jgi:GT2 family glycosyltransferase
MAQPWIVIPTRDGQRWLEGCLPSLRDTVPADVPIVVVDNASRDGTVEYLAGEHPRVRRLELSRNLGFVQAANLGILAARRAGAEAVLLLNNDTRFEPGWFDRLCDAVDGNPEIGVFGVAQEDFDGRPSPRTLVEQTRLRKAGLDEEAPGVVDTDWVEGSCIYIREEVFRRIGYLDPLFAPAYFEEMDFCRRARNQGIRIGFVPQARIAHFGAGSSRTPASGRRRGRRERRRRILCERNYLAYHASDPSEKNVRWSILRRAVRRACQQVLRATWRPSEWLVALGQALALEGKIRCKRQRDEQGRPCPLPGSGLRGGAKHTHYLDWITLIDAAPLFECDAAPEPTPKAPAASVVIPVRNRVEDLEACLQRVLGQSLPQGEFEVLVCDDGSEPVAATRIEAVCSRDVRIRRLRQDPKGPAAARNLGVANARAEFVVFTDSDTLPQPGWLKALLAPFSDAGVVAVEGPVRTPRPSKSALEEAPRSEGGVHLTANMAYRRRTLLQVGGLDEQFPMPAFEDVDLALCAARLGKIAFAPDAVVVHPWRKVGLAASLRRLRQLDWLILTAQRHGCLGWRDRPTRHPRLRVIRAALLTLPAGRIRKAVRHFHQSPGDSLLRIAITFAETAAAFWHLPRWIRAGSAPIRRRYLHGVLR